MKNYLEHIQDSIRSNWDAPALTDIGGDTFTYGNLASEVSILGTIFTTAGLHTGDKIAICARNSSRWGISFIATQAFGAVTVPLLSDFTPENIVNLVNHSESRILITDKDMWNRITPKDIPAVTAVIDCASFTLLYNNSNCDIDLDFIRRWNTVSPEELNYIHGNLDDLAVINYTSGTTSAPKGVMLSYRNLSSNITFALKAVPEKPHQTIVSMLPLAHMYGLMWELIFQLVEGQHIHFLQKVPAPKVLFKAFADVKPYMVITVPLVMEKIFKSAVFPSLEKQKAKTIKRLPFGDSILTAIIRKKILSLFGGNLKYMFIGGAAINEDVENWMKKIRLPYSVGYGMTECAPLLCYSDWRDYLQGSCGRVVDRMQLRIDSSDPSSIPGEILAKGDNVMLGYYKNPEATSAAFTEDGWMKTGDIAMLDKDGNFFMKGRCKNLILGANGQNIYPEEIEDKINSRPYVLESLVVERGRKLVALIYPDYKLAKQDSLDEEAVKSQMALHIANINRLLPSYCRLSGLELMRDEFQKTPKRSIKRFLYC